MDPREATAEMSAGFCRTPFWDWSKTWYTDDPDFTRCFEDTVITYVPLLLLVLMLPFQLYVSHNSRHRLIPWSLLSAAKFLTMGILVLLPYLDMILLSRGQADPAPSSYVAALARSLTYSVVVGILFVNKKQGEVSSGFLLVGWVVIAALYTVNFRTVVRSPDPAQPFSTLVIEYPLVLAMFFVSFFADAKPKYIDMDGEFF